MLTNTPTRLQLNQSCSSQSFNKSNLSTMKSSKQRQRSQDYDQQNANINSNHSSDRYFTSKQKDRINQHKIPQNSENVAKDVSIGSCSRQQILNGFQKFKNKQKQKQKQMINPHISDKIAHITKLQQQLSSSLLQITVKNRTILQLQSKIVELMQQLQCQQIKQTSQQIEISEMKQQINKLQKREEQQGQRQRKLMNKNAALELQVRQLTKEYDQLLQNLQELSQINRRLSNQTNQSIQTIKDKLICLVKEDSLSNEDNLGSSTEEQKLEGIMQVSNKNLIRQKSQIMKILSHERDKYQPQYILQQNKRINQNILSNKRYQFHHVNDNSNNSSRERYQLNFYSKKQDIGQKNIELQSCKQIDNLNKIIQKRIAQAHGFEAELQNLHKQNKGLQINLTECQKSKQILEQKLKEQKYQIQKSIKTKLQNQKSQSGEKIYISENKNKFLKQEIEKLISVRIRMTEDMQRNQQQYLRDITQLKTKLHCKFQETARWEEARNQMNKRIKMYQCNIQHLGNEQKKLKCAYHRLTEQHNQTRKRLLVAEKYQSLNYQLSQELQRLICLLEKKKQQNDLLQLKISQFQAQSKAQRCFI